MLREKLNGIMVVAMVAIFTSCGVGSAPPQSGININICNSAGTTGDCSQEAANTNTAQISQPGGGGGIPPIPPIPPPGGDGGVDGPKFPEDDTGWLPADYREPSPDIYGGKSPISDIPGKIAAQMPQWGDSAIEAEDGESGSEDADEGTLGQLFGDPDLLNWQDDINGLRVARTNMAIYARNTINKWVSAYHRARAVDHGVLQLTPPSTEGLVAMARLVCTGAFAVPSAELAESARVSQVGDTAIDFVGRSVTDYYAGTQISFSRFVNGIEVSGSDCVVRLNNAGELVLAEATWPKFKLATGLTSVRTAAVVAQGIYANLLAGKAVNGVFALEEKLVYVPINNNNDGDISYVPAVEAAVLVRPGAGIEAEVETLSVIAE